MASANGGWIWSPPHNDYYRVTYDNLSQPIYHFYKSPDQPTATTIAGNEHEVTVTQATVQNEQHGYQASQATQNGQYSHSPQQAIQHGQYSNSPPRTTQNSQHSNPPQRAVPYSQYPNSQQQAIQYGYFLDPSAQSFQNEQHQCSTTQAVPNWQHPQLAEVTTGISQYQYPATQSTAQSSQLQQPIVQTTHSNSYQHAGFIPNHMAQMTLQTRHNQQFTPLRQSPNSSSPEDFRHQSQQTTHDSASTIRKNKTSQLDSSYQRRDERFFKRGKVFAMLYTVAAGTESNIANNGDAYTLVRFGEMAHSSIRRFIVFSVGRGFVYACPITTYSSRGATKQGCDPNEHAVVYFYGTNPDTCYIGDERERGMTKKPIEVIPTDKNEKMKRESRVRFASLYNIEMNIKVKDIGQVDPAHISRLVAYCKEYMDISVTD